MHDNISILFCGYTLAKVQHLLKIAFNIASMSGDETRDCWLNNFPRSCFLRPRSPSTPTTWSIGWRTFTHQAMTHCWKEKRQSSGGPSCVKLEPWSQLPPALWSWSSSCRFVPWKHEPTGRSHFSRGELVLFSVLYLFPVVLLANIKMTVSASVWQTSIQQVRIIYLTYLFFQICSFIVLLRTVRDSSFIWWSSKLSWIYYCSQGTIFLFFGIMYSVFWAKLFLMNYLVECENWPLILLSFLSNGEHFK